MNRHERRRLEAERRHLRPVEPMSADQAQALPEVCAEIKKIVIKVVEWSCPGCGGRCAAHDGKDPGTGLVQGREAVINCRCGKQYRVRAGSVLVV